MPLRRGKTPPLKNRYVEGEEAGGLEEKEKDSFITHLIPGHFVGKKKKRVFVRLGQGRDFDGRR